MKTHEWTAESRFALYYVPARDSAWWRAGCEWLARDPESDEALVPPTLPALTARSRDVASLTRAPRRYGWHGTLVAPARRAPGVTPDEVLNEARAWARRQRPFELAVEAAALGQFAAIRPATDDGDAAMRGLAADGLRELACLRAAPNENERQRRLDGHLSARQRELLDLWGYPYVLEEFRFHMTLSDSIDAHDRAAIVDWWSAHLPALGPLEIDTAAVFVERSPGTPFALVARLPFEGRDI